jgi:sugar lactone lactonase YvrE
MTTPQRWTPPPPVPMEGDFAPNAYLDDVELLEVGPGPEDPLPDGEGGVVVGLHDGRIVRLDLDSRETRQLAFTGGRPLGLDWDRDGDLVVCDAEQGVLRVARTGGEPEVLVARGEGPGTVGLANNPVVGSDGTLWFTDSTRDRPVSQAEEAILDHLGDGRLLRRDPDGSLEVVKGGMTFANGVTLTADEDALLVASTGDYTLTRIELTGQDAGAETVLFDPLPGFPDNLSTGPDGTIWLAMPAPRNPAADFLLPRHPMLRRIVERLPEAVKPSAERHAFVLGLGPDGEVRHNLQGSGERYHYVTGVREHDGWLYLGSETDQITSIARVRRP